MSDDVISKPIYDNNGKYMGNVTGRREQLERYNNRDLADQLKRDNDKARDNQRR